MDEPRVRGYAIERLLGSGGSADVWQARVAASGERVALKRIPVADEAQRRRAVAEAAVLTALDHPNLVRLHAVVPVDGALVLVLDLAAGGSLAQLLQARGRLAPGEVITAVGTVAAAAAYLHEAGVVHGDISPANVLFTADGVPLLADVGVARLTGDDADAAATPGYVDPVVAAGGVPSPRSDVFMLGAVALHALTGKPAWPGSTADEALAAAVGRDPAGFAARLAAAGVPATMAAVVERALARDPHRRAGAADFALDLGHSGSAVAVELAAGTPRAEPQPRTGPRHAAWAPRPPSAPVGEPGRPSFERPGRSCEAGLPPPTRMVGARPRPVIPRPAARRRIRPRLAALVVSASVAAAAGGWTLWPRPADRPAAAAQARHPATQARPQVETTMPEQVDWAAVLAGLDAQRAAAFAARDPSRLRRVYVPGPLLSADTTLLSRIVPAGCGLLGARTRYTGVQLDRDATTIRLTATATLAPSRLVCGGRPRGSAPGAGPTRLRLELRQTADGARIAEQQVSG